MQIMQIKDARLTSELERLKDAVGESYGPLGR